MMSDITLKNHDIDFILAADPHMVQEMESPVGQRFDEYFDSFELLISDTFSQLSQIEKAVAFEIWQLEF